MNRILFLALFIAVNILSMWPLSEAEALSINDRVVEPSQESTNNFLIALKKALKENPKGKLHGLATFSRYLSPDERTFLAKLGINVLEPYQETTYWVSLSKPANLHQLLSNKLEFALIPILAQDRVHPKILTASFDSFVLTPTGGEPFNYVLNNDGTLNLTVRFHVDVSESQATKLLSKYAKQFTKKSPVTWVVVVSQTALKALAKEDSVQWIEAGPLPFLPENDMTSKVIKVDLVRGAGTPPLDGSGVRIGIFDYGIDQDHPDFGNRVDPNDPGAQGTITDDHGTGVAGTVAGSGKTSAEPYSFGCSQTGTQDQWVGMAPQSLLIERPWSEGDSPEKHESLIASPQGMHLSNHSYTISDLDGEYSEKDRVRDAMIRGTTQQFTIPPRLSVFSAGNQGMSNEPYKPQYPQRHLYQKGYFSLTKQLKNGLVVGNWQAVEDNPPDPLNPKDRIFRTSSLGPTHDGRIKPDVVAPGRLIVSPAYPQTESGCTWYYLGSTGSSMSAAAVSGTLALLIQRYASVYGINNILDLSNRMPLPSTLRAVMIHTATDIQSPSTWFCNPDGNSSAPCPVGGNGHAGVWANEGPDFVTGWGLIDAQAAIQIVDNKLFSEGRLPYGCARTTYAFSVTSAGDPLRITLAWDDYPASPQIPSRDRKLVNDLDLVLIDPNGVHYYPWRLNQNVFNSSNVLITDPSRETCTEHVQVSRHVDPTLNPSGNNDPVPPGGFPPAVRGTDHLNNVEVVDVTAPIPGTWQAKVIGFGIPWGPQTFSLVGAEFTPITVVPEATCRIQGLTFCSGMSLTIVCQQTPEVCTNQVAYYGKPLEGWIRVKFNSPKEKAIIPINKLCGLAFQCPPCIKSKSCSKSFVRIDTKGTPQVLDVEIFSYRGQLLRTHYSSWKDNQVQVPAGDLLVAIKPTKFATLATDYEARIQISDHKIP